MNELALFAGAGGGILGGTLLGWRTVCAVERDAYAAAILAQRQNDGLLQAFPIWSDVETFDGRPWQGIVDVVSGGFPCQDISAAGKGAGITGERSGLWSEMARIIGEVRPRYVFVENSPLLVRRGLTRVLGDLAKMGFDARWGIVGAADAGAPHIRKRIWIVANANGSRWTRAGSSQPEKWDSDFIPLRAGQKVFNPDKINGHDSKHGTGDIFRERSAPAEILADSQSYRREPRRASDSAESSERRESDRGGEQGSLPDTNGAGLEIREGITGDNGKEFPPVVRVDWWDAEPGMDRVVNGLAFVLDKP